MAARETLASLCLLLACGGTASEDMDSGDDGISGSSGLTETSSGSSTGAGSTGPLLDAAPGTGSSDGGSEAGGEGCEKVDILFVIDNSGSMEDEQANLLAAFDGFIEQIQTALAGVDSYHVGVITTDSYIGNAAPCNVDGALVTQTFGQGSSNASCGPFASGKSFMTEADLDTQFGCAAQVGIAGDGDERPVQALQAAISESMNAPGACNDGFVREDAILVVVIITDEEDDHEVDGCDQLPQPGSAGDPPGWYQGIIARKAGVETNVVMLSLVGPTEQAQTCPALDKCAGGIDGAEPCHRLVELTNSFTHGFIGRVCEPTYDTFFGQAVGVIESACDGFIPPG